MDLFRHGRPMALVTLNCMFNWLVNSITYYGLSLNGAALPTNLYVSNLVYAAAEIISYVFAIYVIEHPRIGRRGGLGGFLLLGGACTLLSTICSEIAFCE